MSDRFIEKRLNAMKSQPQHRLGAIANDIEGVLRLSGGDPDFDTPKHIRDAAYKAMEEGRTHYPPMPGIPSIREALVEYNGQYGVDWKPSEVVLTAGSGLALYLAMAGTLNAGDEVMLLEPYFMAYKSLLSYLGMKKSPVPLVEETNWHLDLEAVKEGITPKTKMIVLCSPNNPSGTVFNKKELEGIADVAKDNDLLVLSDEVYNEFVWDGLKHLSIAALPGMKERTLVCNSFSKTWAMTGWRMGYVIADEPIASKLTKIPVGYRPTSFIQNAGVAALKGPWEPVTEMLKEYDKRRKYLVNRLNEIEGIECQMPEGAFYLFPNHKAIGIKSEKYCERLLREEKVLVYPGTTFGDSSDYHVRIPLVVPVESLENVAVAMEKIR
jgi:aminotransferase